MEDMWIIWRSVTVGVWENAQVWVRRGRVV